MCFQPINLKNRIITSDQSQFDMKGMMNPTFQNQGETFVFIDGRKLMPGESFPVNIPNTILQNTLPIYFEKDAAKQNILYVGYGELANDNELI